MLATIVATRVCQSLRETFRPIRGDSGEVAGTTWIETCAADEDGTDITLKVAGRGWRWVSKESEAAGATFEVDSYVRFRFSVAIHGAIDAAYAPKSKIFTLWFTPDGRPEAKFEPVGDVDVDSDGMWASVVGGTASLFGESPETRAEEKVEQQGKKAFADQFASGIAMTLDLCTGEVRSGLGHPKAGDMLGPPTKLRQERAVVQPGGLLLDGPVRMASKKGQLVCAEDAVKLAEAFMAERPLPAVRAAKKGCKLVHVIKAQQAPLAMTYEVSRVAARLPELAACDSDKTRKE